MFDPLFNAWNVSIQDLSPMVNLIHKLSLKEQYVNFKVWFWDESAFAYMVLIGMALMSIIVGAEFSLIELSLNREGTLIGMYIRTVTKYFGNFRSFPGATLKMSVYFCLLSLGSIVLLFFFQCSLFEYKAIFSLIGIFSESVCCSNIYDSYNIACKKIAKLQRLTVTFFPKFTLILLGNYPYKYPEDAIDVEEEVVHLRNRDIGKTNVNYPRKEDSIFVVHLDTKIIIVLLIGMISHYLIRGYDFSSNETFENQKLVLLVHNFLVANLLVFCVKRSLFNFQASVTMLLLFLLYNLLIYDVEPCRNILERFRELSRFIMVKKIFASEKQSQDILAAVEFATLEFGDMFFPGQFIAHCYHFDKRNVETHKEQDILRFPGIYTLTSIVMFVVLLALHFFVGDRLGGVKVLGFMYAPLLLGGAFSLSIWRREFDELIKFNIKNKLTTRSMQSDYLSETEVYGSDSDYYVSDESEWEQLVEDKLDIDEEIIETDSDDLNLLIKDQEQPIFLPITYEFESDDDDDTYVIGSDESPNSRLSDVEYDLSESTDGEVISESSEEY